MSINREAYLELAAWLIEPMFDQPFPVLRVSVGWPSKRAGSVRNRRIGECHAPQVASDGRTNIFVSPCLDQASEVLATLVHELVHAVVGCKAGHKAPFKRLATKVGLTGKMTATVAGPELAERLNAISSAIGSYPHGAVSLNSQTKQSTRLLKVTCLVEGYTVRVTRKWLDELGAPTCPCGATMKET